MLRECACDVIALTWNQLDVTKDFVKSFLANTILPSRLIIIDNASTDGTREYLSSLKSTLNCSIEVILNEDNAGFVRGMNQGIRISSAPYVCLANNDLLFANGWLKEIIAVFEKDSRIGLLNPNSNNLGAVFSNDVSLQDFAENLRVKYQGVFVEMPYCIGFCMVIKREVIDKVGGFSDEFYPMFFEDTDYSMKVARAGYLTGTAKASYVLHKEHTSIRGLGKAKEKIFRGSRETFKKKWGPILRVAWIIEDLRELEDNLERGIELARQGNYLWFFVKGADVEREEFFRKKNLYEHSGVQFIRFNNVVQLFWKILKKKKRFDWVISGNELMRRVLGGIGCKVYDRNNKPL